MLVSTPRPTTCKFSDVLAGTAVEFFERYCKHTKGQWSGRPFQLCAWQAHHIREIFGRIDEFGNRVIRTVYWEIPKKNGKSEIAAGVALKLLFADDEPGAEIYGAAADRDQANIVFDVAAQMVRMDPALLRAAGGEKGIIDSRKRIVCPSMGSFYRALSAEVGGKHGFNTHGCIFDEIHAQPHMRLWEVLTFGAGAIRRQPLTFAITTAGIPNESPVAEMLHDESEAILKGTVPCPDSFYPVIYAAGKDDDWQSEDVWRSCNPAYGDFLAPASVREEFDRARRRPSEQNSFRRLRLNQWVQQQVRWISLEDWDQCNGIVDIQNLKHLPCYAGVDMSATRDVTALVIVWLDGANIFHWLPFFWIPRDTLADRSPLESEKYKRWAEMGLLTLTDGKATDPRVVRDRLLELQKSLAIQQVCLDKTFALQLMQDLQEDGFTVIDFPQGFAHYNEPCTAFEDAIAERRIRHGGNPVLRWMADSVGIAEDRAGRIMPTKPRRQESTKRIDGIVAGLMATSRAVLDDTPKDPYASGARLMIV